MPRESLLAASPGEHTPDRGMEKIEYARNRRQKRKADEHPGANRGRRVLRTKVKGGEAEHGIRERDAGHSG